IIVDTYGGSCPHGGGAFSGKDPTKVDRSAAYAARYAAKNIVAANLADKIQIQLSYAIGVSKPISISIDTFQTEKISREKILKVLYELFDFTPLGIIKKFGLLHPNFKYQDLSNYGHFGRPDIDLPWEELDKVVEIQDFVNNLD
ncbi:MAG TPA: methionine adenosyltransferase, partial [Firmicutes bacterium]|nr:methionine adenosyltransferase [Bacillota bacterium]